VRQILAATDFSERSHRAVRRADLLARESGARLMLLHVVDDDRDARIVEAESVVARAMLGEMKKGLASGSSCEARLEMGDPFDGIIRTARECAADLVVMGAHRRQLLRDIFVGTSIERVTRSRVAPVLMVNAEPTAPYRRALLGVDLSEHSAYALRFARKAGIVSHAELAVAHAVAVMGKGQLNFAGVERAKILEYVAEAEAKGRADVAEFLAKHDPDAPEPVMRVAEGHPPIVVAAVAQSVGADLVILATHGLSGLPKLLLGSVTEALMRDLDRDVLAVPPRGRA
jgi:nucleotide-binding universal stress UspA family protein